ncbi:MAG: TauD/TfdA family dioxygenase [Candidatus Eremiobacteraeota bacterium]|nr:TauD/TfdA family dioxygenase [Candidatus Eremiobacteraeota bacterium]
MIVPMLDERIRGHQAWTRDSLAPRDWIVEIPSECLREIRAALVELRGNRLPIFLLGPDDFQLEACRALMHGVRRQLDEGVMFAVLDRLPLEEMTRDEATQVYWLLASLVARPVAQKFDGTMFYEVSDTGAQLKPGSGIRPTVTNVELTFHNDNSYNETQPHYVALLCFSKSLEGGRSRVISMYTVHNVLLEQHRDVLPRLYRPFWFDRHAEHEPDDVKVFAAPVFEYDGRLRTRLAHREVYAGYELRGERLDDEGTRALTAVQTVFDTPLLRVELDFEPGQIQFVNNRATGHARTEFLDGPEPHQKRRLLRMWLRDSGKRSYRG